MSEPRLAQVRGSARSGPYADLWLDVGSPPLVRAGQWISVHTTLPHPEKPGQVVKRAWSVAEADGGRWRLFVATVGPASCWLAERSPGEMLRFTGPWGSRFLLDEGHGPVGLFAIGSGISPIGAMVDEAMQAGRPVLLRWETPHCTMEDRLDRWARRGVEVQVGPRLPDPEGDRPWWFAGDGTRIDELRGDTPPSRIERFYERPPEVRA